MNAFTFLTMHVLSEHWSTAKSWADATTNTTPAVDQNAHLLAIATLISAVIGSLAALLGALAALLRANREGRADDDDDVLDLEQIVSTTQIVARADESSR